MLEVLEKRYNILQHIFLTQPIGRRSLANSLGMTERVLRAEIDFLKNQGLIDVDSIGMKLTRESVQLLEEVSPFLKKLFGLHELELELQKKLQITKAIIIPGNLDEEPSLKRDLGRATAQFFRRIVKENDVVALTGGSTIAAFAEMVSDQPSLENVLFVPARGGMGEEHEYLANTLASLMAKRTGGTYRLLHVPDQLSEDTYQSLMNEGYVQEILNLIRSASIVIHGIGKAKPMAIRRGASSDVIRLLEEKAAVGEAFGYYFDGKGEIIHHMNIIGLQLDDLNNIPHVIAVAGGKSKAEAILAVIKKNIHPTLITDEGAAREIIRML